MSNEFFEDKEDKPKKKTNDFFKQKRQGKIVLINKRKGKITIEVNGNGELIDYIEGVHANLKIGDSIEL